MRYGATAGDSVLSGGSGDVIAQFAEITSDVSPYDVCIVGGGAVGLSMAAALVRSSLRVAILEAGGARQTKAAQALYKGELADPSVHPFLHHFRVRALGGTSRVWGGRCVPLDTIDFERREWVTNSGWPITRGTLLPYYTRAQDVVEAGRFDYDPASALPHSQAEIVPGLDGNLFETRLERFSRPTNIWKRYKRILRRASNVDIWLEAAVTGIVSARAVALSIILMLSARTERCVRCAPDILYWLPAVLRRRDCCSPQTTFCRTASATAAIISAGTIWRTWPRLPGRSSSRAHQMPSPSTMSGTLPGSTAGGAWP